MALRFRALVALAENQGSVSKTHMVAHTTLVLDDDPVSFSGLQGQQSQLW